MKEYRNSKWHRHYGVYGVCINSRKEIMLIKKNGGPYTGLYDLPGGGMENPESLKECVQREILEETGFTVSVVDFMGFFDFITNTPYNGYDYTHHIALIYQTKIEKKENQQLADVVINNDVEDENDSLGYEWVSLEAISQDNSSPLVLRVKQKIEERIDCIYELYEYGVD